VQLGELVQSRGGQVDFAAVDDILTVRLHEDWVAAVVLVEAARTPASRQHRLVVHGEGVVAILESCQLLSAPNRAGGDIP
jgi:hypothetical protein